MIDFSLMKTAEDKEAERAVARIEELKNFLKESDYKVLPDYDKPNQEIKEQRKAWRKEIRQLGNSK